MKVKAGFNQCLLVTAELEDPGKLTRFTKKVLEATRFEWGVEKNGDRSFDLAKKFLAEEALYLNQEFSYLTEPFFIAVVFGNCSVCFPVEQLLNALDAVRISLMRLVNIREQLVRYGWDSVSWKVKPGSLHTLYLSEIDDVGDSLNRLKSRIDRMMEASRVQPPLIKLVESGETDPEAYQSLVNEILAL